MDKGDAMWLKLNQASILRAWACIVITQFGCKGGSADGDAADATYLDAHADASGDAIPAPDGPLPLPDISGTFLMSLSTTLDPAKPILFYTEITMTNNDEEGTALVDFSATPLTVAELTPVGDPLVSVDVQVSNAGEGAAPFAGPIDGAANPIVPDNELEVDIVAHFLIYDEDFYCGDITGGVTRPTPIPLGGSTVGAVRIAEGTLGEDLPVPVYACPEEESVGRSVRIGASGSVGSE